MTRSDPLPSHPAQEAAFRLVQLLDALCAELAAHALLGWLFAGLLSPLRSRLRRIGKELRRCAATIMPAPAADAATARPEALAIDPHPMRLSCDGCGIVPPRRAPARPLPESPRTMPRACSLAIRFRVAAVPIEIMPWAAGPIYVQFVTI